jgi:transposase-like protein
LKRTHKFQSLSGVAGVIARSASLTAAARQLGVNRSTLHRWIAAGKVAGPESRPSRGRSTTGSQRSPESWAQWVRETFDLNGTEDALVKLAEQALALAQDQGAKPEVRLSAMGRFQQLTRQLDFEEETDGKAEEATTPDRSWPRRVG